MNQAHGTVHAEGRAAQWGAGYVAPTPTHYEAGELHGNDLNPPALFSVSGDVVPVSGRNLSQLGRPATRVLQMQHGKCRVVGEYIAPCGKSMVRIACECGRNSRSMVRSDWIRRPPASCKSCRAAGAVKATAPILRATAEPV